MNRRLNRTQRNYIIIGLCAILVIMWVWYAAFQSQLKISGTSNITSNFLVRITDIQSTVQSGAASDVQAQHILIQLQHLRQTWYHQEMPWNTILLYQMKEILTQY